MGRQGGKTILDENRKTQYLCETQRAQEVGKKISRAEKRKMEVYHKWMHHWACASDTDIQMLVSHQGINLLDRAHLMGYLFPITNPCDHLRRLYGYHKAQI